MPIEHVSPIDVARALAPKIWLHPCDPHRPTSVEWFLNRCQLVRGSGELTSGPVSLPDGMKTIETGPGPLNPASLAAASKFEPADNDLSLFPLPARVREQATANWAVPELLRGYFTDINQRMPEDPSKLRTDPYFYNYQLRTFLGDTHGGPDWKCTAPMYVRIATQGEYYLISYLAFFAYQSGIGFYSNWDAVPLSIYSGWGAHVGDSERLTAKITINNQNLVSLIDVDYEAHGESEFVKSSAFKDKPLSQIPHLIACAAWHSHAMYPDNGILGTGIHPRHLYYGGLINDLTGEGPVWDTAANLHFISDNMPSWVRYNGRWGANISLNRDPFYENLGSGPRGPAFHGYWTNDTHPGNAPIKQWRLAPNVALEFNGLTDASGSYVLVSNAPDLRLSDKFTLEAFVYWNGKACNPHVISKPSLDNHSRPGGTGYALGLSDGKPGLGLITASADRRDPAHNRSTGSASPIPANTWTAVAVSYDGQRAITYVNGTEVGRKEWPEVLGAPQSETALLIGREFLHSHFDRAFGGRLADVRIWKAALPADTIGAWCGKQSLDGHPQTDALLARWLFDEGQGSVALDSSGHGYDGVLYGATWNTSADRKREFLKTGQFLGTGDYLTSSDGKHFAVMQGDGNLVVYRGTDPAHHEGFVWGSLHGEPKVGNYFAVMQGDGNLVVYRGTDPAHNEGFVWGSNH
jgi:hypothetical protein